jgi:hypothetical protein
MDPNSFSNSSYSCSSEDVDSVIKLTNEAFRATRSGDMGKEYPTLLCKSNANNLKVIKQTGKVASTQNCLVVELSSQRSLMLVS